ncbi:MAG: hypothetical protein R3321_09020 [Nitrososphaeraceae archaeon]|nr:hypothetical protein [Nitrososphaeraceae archaeon]
MQFSDIDCNRIIKKWEEMCDSDKEKYANVLEFFIKEVQKTENLKT